MLARIDAAEDARTARARDARGAGGQARRACGARTRRRRSPRHNRDPARAPRWLPPGRARACRRGRRAAPIVRTAAAGIERGARRVRGARHPQWWRLCIRGAWLGRPRAALLAAQTPLEPGHVEQLSAGALGRRQREIRLGEQAVQQHGVAPARGAPGAVLIEGLPAMAQDPGIQQPVCRTRVETRHLACRARAP